MEFLDLVRKWEDKRGLRNMVHANPRGDKHGKDPSWVDIVTQGGTQIGQYLGGECNAILLVEPRIKKVTQPLPKFLANY